MFSAPLMFRHKAQCATKTQSTRCARGVGSGCSIGKRCNAVAGHQGSALRVSLSALMDCVVPFGKGLARAGPMSGAQPMSVENALAAANAVGLPCKARLAMNADKLTEYDNISWKGH
jgi:hypothetical protein